MQKCDVSHDKPTWMDVLDKNDILMKLPFSDAIISVTYAPNVQVIEEQA